MMDIPQTDLSTGERTVLIPHHKEGDVAVCIEEQLETQPFLTAEKPVQPANQSKTACAYRCLTNQQGFNSSLDNNNFCTDQTCSVNVDVNDETSSSEAKVQRLPGRKIQFHVGQDRQLMVGRDCDLAAISPMFAAMSSKKWRKEENEPVMIPDVEPRAFGVILRCAAGDSDLHLSDDTVWDVLKAADMFLVTALVKQCFHFLLHRHQCRRRSSHICMVLETAHGLNYTEHYAECMEIAKRKGDQIFKSERGLRELCHDCMLALVQADNLRVDSEMLVHDAVITWARCACAKKGVENPSQEELRDMAGEMAHHVRYFTMPASSLKNLRAGHPSACLLTGNEIEQLLKGDARNFPTQATKMREKEESALKKAAQDICHCLTNRRNPMLSVFFLVGLLLLIVFLIFYLTYAFVLKGSDVADVLNGDGN